MTPTLALVAAAAVVLVAIVVLYNRLVRQRNRMDNSRSSVPVELRRHYDLTDRGFNTSEVLAVGVLATWGR